MGKHRTGTPMKFPYLKLKTRRPVYPLGGIRVRYRPCLPLEVIGPLGGVMANANLDCGADDTIFPSQLCSLLGIHLVGAPQGEGAGIGAGPVLYSYATLRLRL